MAIYDQPAIIDYILDETKNSKLLYVGHSQGGTTLLTMLSERPEYNEKLYAASLLAPAGYMTNTHFIFQFLGQTRSIFEVIIFIIQFLHFIINHSLYYTLNSKYYYHYYYSNIFQLIERTETFPRNRLLSEYIYSICANDPSLCNYMLNSLGGPSVNQRNDVNNTNIFFLLNNNNNTHVHTRVRIYMN